MLSASGRKQPINHDAGAFLFDPMTINRHLCIIAGNTDFDEQKVARGVAALAGTALFDRPSCLSVFLFAKLYMTNESAETRKAMGDSWFYSAAGETVWSRWQYNVDLQDESFNAEHVFNWSVLEYMLIRARGRSNDEAQPGNRLG